MQKTFLTLLNVLLTTPTPAAATVHEDPNLADYTVIDPEEALAAGLGGVHLDDDYVMIEDDDAAGTSRTEASTTSPTTSPTTASPTAAASSAASPTPRAHSVPTRPCLCTNSRCPAHNPVTIETDVYTPLCTDASFLKFLMNKGLEKIIIDFLKSRYRVNLEHKAVTEKGLISKLQDKKLKLEVVEFMALHYYSHFCDQLICPEGERFYRTRTPEEIFALLENNKTRVISGTFFWFVTFLPFERSPEKAVSFLKEIGVATQASFSLKCLNGKPVRFEITRSGVLRPEKTWCCERHRHLDD